jgi:capsid protein
VSDKKTEYRPAVPRFTNLKDRRPKNLKAGSYHQLGYGTAQTIRSSPDALPQEGTADYHLRFDQELLGREAERQDRDNSVAESLLNRAEEIVLGKEGLHFQARTPDEGLNREIERQWSRWAEAPEARGLFSWQDCERLALRNYNTRGDVGVLRLSDERKLQYVEGARIRKDGALIGRNEGNWVEGGVELNDVGKPVAFWVVDFDQLGFVRQGSSRRYEAEDFLLFAHRKRFSQTRGVSPIAAILPQLHRLNDILDSEAIAWQQLSRFTVAVNIEGGPALGFDSSTIPNTVTTGSANDPPDLTDRVVAWSRGRSFGASPERPSPAFRATSRGHSSRRAFGRSCGS